MTPYDILNRSRNKEILLTKTKAFSLRMIVGRVENLANNLRHSLLLNCSYIVSLIEK